MGRRGILTFNVILFTFISLFQYNHQKSEVNVLQPKIEFFECSEQNYENTNFLNVKNIQIFLQNEDFFEGKLNGYVDENLISSIKAFQKYVSIRVDGIIGPSTHKAMTSYDSCENKVTASMIDCGDYMAYKECTFFVSNINNPTTTTTIPIQTNQSKVDCDDGGVMWNGKKGTLWNAEGDWMSYENCAPQLDFL